MPARCLVHGEWSVEDSVVTPKVPSSPAPIPGRGELIEPHPKSDSLDGTRAVQGEHLTVLKEVERLARSMDIWDLKG